MHSDTAPREPLHVRHLGALVNARCVPDLLLAALKS
jgi:hypothetical protein